MFEWMERKKLEARVEEMLFDFSIDYVWPYATKTVEER
jgi:hypothetical protein